MSRLHLAYKPATLWPVAVIVLASFGPYVVGSLRTEQMAVYGIGLLAMFSLPLVFRTLSKAWIGVFVTWGLMLAVLIILGIWPIYNDSGYASSSTFATLDNYTAPMVLMIIVAYWIATGRSRRSLMVTISNLVVWLMVVNALLSIYDVSSGGGLRPYLTVFWAPVNDITVATLALELDRVTGIFNQPAEAGTLYAVALVLALYLFQSQQRSTIWLISISAILLTGGLLTVSKIFILIGIPVALVYYLWSGKRRLKVLIASVATVVVATSTSGFGFFPQWGGADYLLRLFTPKEGGSLIQLYSAYRLGENSTLSIVARSVFPNHPIWGLGPRGIKAPYDSSWLELLVIGGSFAIIVFAVILFMLMRRCYHPNNGLPPLERGAAWALLAVSVGATTGFPALTANRTSTVIWLLLTVLLLSDAPWNGKGPPTTDVAAEPAAHSMPGARPLDERLTPVGST